MEELSDLHVAATLYYGYPQPRIQDYASRVTMLDGKIDTDEHKEKRKFTKKLIVDDELTKQPEAKSSKKSRAKSVVAISKNHFENATQARELIADEHFWIIVGVVIGTPVSTCSISDWRFNTHSATPNQSSTLLPLLSLAIKKLS